MADYNLKNIGTAEVEKKKVSCKFSIDASTFFDRYSNLEDLLSSNSRNAIEKAIDSGDSQKIKNSGEIDEFFSRVMEAAESESDDVVEDEPVEDEPAAADDDDDSSSSSSSSSSAVAEDSQAVSDIESAEGDLVPVAVVETIVAKYTYNYLAEKEEKADDDSDADADEDADADADADEDKPADSDEEKEELPEGYGILTREGALTIKNSSDSAAIWDLSGKIVNNGAIEDLAEELYIQSILPEAEQSFEYKLAAEKEPSLKVTEFISTINDPETLTYSLNIDQDNVVYYKLKLTNTEEYAIQNISVKKELFEGYSDMQVLNTSIGDSTTEEGSLVWTIEELEVGSEQSIEFTLTVSITDKEQTIKSGVVEITYDAAVPLSELQIENFEAFSENKVTLLDEQLDDNPDLFRSNITFENLSPYIAKLKAVTVKQMEGEDELIDLPEDAELYLSANTSWVSNSWEVDTQGESPLYAKKAEFILMHELVSTTSTSITIDDTELAVAMMEAGVSYDIGEIESHREVPFNANHVITNGGNSPFDYISVKQDIPEHFKAPKKEDIKLLVDGKEYDLDPDWITIDPEDEESDHPHEILIELDNMKDLPMGQLMPNQKLEVVYPIIADKLTEDETFVTNAEWKANTFPRGEPIVITEIGETEDMQIVVVHKRLKILKGKTILATSDPAVYDVVLEVTNNSDFDQENYTVRDRVPANFDAVDFTTEVSESSDMDGLEVHTWVLEKLEAGASFEIKYQIKATSEDAAASDAQFSM
jgi:hypothetical protein